MTPDYTVQAWKDPDLREALDVPAHPSGEIELMGDDPADSVVNSYGQSHEAPNLFVVGGGTFPTLSAYNPTATLQSLALRTADFITRESKTGGALAGVITRETATV